MTIGDNDVAAGFNTSPLMTMLFDVEGVVSFRAHRSVHILFNPDF